MNRPVVLCFSGHDPSGGAGIQADIETLSALNCHAVSIITAITEQDTVNVKKLIPQHPEDIVKQAETLLADFPVSAFKIGLIGHHETAAAIHKVLVQHPLIPVIFDPVLAAGGGAALSSEPLIKSMIDLLLPCTTVLTPNSQEARKLAGLDSLVECGKKLLNQGCEYVLITGTHESTEDVCNQLFHDDRCIETYHWPRLPASYHGSGCTLTAAIAASIAQRSEIKQAIYQAQHYTWRVLEAAFKPGQGQYIPDRLSDLRAGLSSSPEMTDGKKH